MTLRRAPAPAPGLPESLVTAEIVPGVITGRVKQVRRTRAGQVAARDREAVAIRLAADAIASTRRRGSPTAEAALEPPPKQRAGRRLPAAERATARIKGLPAGWHLICASVNAETLDRLDSAIARLAAAGLGTLSRSRLIRIAVARLDVDAVTAELRRVR